jgi:hypothetical protein
MNVGRRPWAIAIALATLVLGLLVVTIFIGSAEPKYGGRVLSAWLDDLRPATMPWTPGVVRTPTGSYFRRIPPAALAQEKARTEKAAAAVSAIGTNAIPHLVTRIYSRDSNFKIKLTTLIRKQSVLRIPLKVAADNEAQGLSGLAELGPAAMWAWINVLTNKLSSQNAQSYASQHLHIHNGDATAVVPALLMLVDHPSPWVRDAIRRAILRADTTGFVLSLHDLQHSPAPNARAGAAWSLGFHCEHADKTVPALLKGLSDESANVRETVVEAIGKFGTNAVGTADFVRRALDDSNQRVRIAATNALNQVLGVTVTN